MSDCLFCAIAAGAIPAEIVRETDEVVVFRDVNPQAPFHVLSVPREHYGNVVELAADPRLLAAVIGQGVAAAIAGGCDAGYRIVFNTGAEAGQTVDHVHAHVLGGRRLTWPPG